MRIPQGDWIIVRRAVRGDPWDRGDIVRSGMSEAQARASAKSFSQPGYNYWPMLAAYY